MKTLFTLLIAIGLSTPLYSQTATEEFRTELNDIAQNLDAIADNEKLQFADDETEAIYQESLKRLYRVLVLLNKVEREMAPSDTLTDEDKRELHYLSEAATTVWALMEAHLSSEDTFGKRLIRPIEQLGHIQVAVEGNVAFDKVLRRTGIRISTKGHLEINSQQQAETQFFALAGELRGLLAQISDIKPKSKVLRHIALLMTSTKVPQGDGRGLIGKPLMSQKQHDLLISEN